MSSFTLPNVTPSIRMAGARAQQPMQRTVRSVNVPWLSVWPADADLLLQAFQEEARSADETGRPQADLDRVPPRRLKAEGVVEAGHAENLGQGDRQPGGDVLQRRRGT